MNKMDTENFLLDAIKWLIILTMFTPLIVSSSTLFPYVFGKAIAFQVLIELALICYLYLIYINRRRTGRFDYLPRLNLLGWTLIIFFIVLVLGTIFSVDPHYSFWSKQERMDGLFNLFHFFVLFFLVSATFKNKQSWLYVLNASIIASLLVSLHAFGQKFGLFYTPYGNRVTGPLGNAAFLGTYLLFNIFFAAFLLVQTKNTGLKSWYSGIIIFETIILFLTYTRGTIFGLVAGTVIFLIGFLLSGPFLGPKNRAKKIILAFLLLLVLAGGALFLARNTNFVKTEPLLYRLTDLSFETGTGKIRLISWKIGLDAFLEKPLLGWGQENYYVALNKHLNPVFFYHSGETFDRAHNRLVDVLVMDGILGLLAYLSIFVMATFLLWRKIKDSPTLTLILIALLGSYFIQNLLLFDMPISYLMFFLSLGLINFAIGKQTTKSDQKPVETKSGEALKYLIWFLIFIVVIFFWSGNLKPLLASQNSIKGQQILGAQNASDQTFKLALATFEKSINYHAFTNPETKKALTQVILGTVGSTQYSSPTKIDGLKFASNQLEQGIKEMPLFIDYYLYIDDVYNYLAQQDKSYLDKGGEIAKKLVALYPNLPQAYYKLIINRLIAGDYQQAVEAGQKITQLAPQLSPTFWYLGVSYFYAGNTELAKANVEKALSMDYNYESNQNSMLLLAQLYTKTKEYERAARFYNDLLSQKPDDLNVAVNLASLYKEMGQFDKAREIANELLTTRPESAQQINQFLDELKQLETENKKP
ncbi:MAG: O-antigen ligase family protein [Candidatus Portnoybacteria bacterium]|nr:O-antigen ligase family protein [Candidatus Portnoybacteria bacterium]